MGVHRVSQQFTQPFDESLYNYLLSINESDQAKAIEDGYNLHDCCSRFAHEPFFALFTEVHKFAIRIEYP